MEILIYILWILSIVGMITVTIKRPKSGNKQNYKMFQRLLVVSVVIFALLTYLVLKIN